MLTLRPLATKAPIGGISSFLLAFSLNPL